MKPISRPEINKALRDIEDTHPLRNVEGRHIFKVLGLCQRKPKKFKHCLRLSMLKEMDMQMPLSDQQIEEEPFLILGYGVNSYFDLLSYMSIMFVIVTIFALPIMKIYSSHDGFSEHDNYPLSKFSLGNLGGSSVFCGQYRIGKGEADISCPKNTIIDTSNAVFGVMSVDLESKHYCHQSAIDEHLLETN
jgi:hypothetical protein